MARSRLHSPLSGVALEFACYLAKARGSAPAEDFFNWIPIDCTVEINRDSLYVFIKRMRIEGLLKQSERIPMLGVPGPGYRIYSLTPLARKRLEATLKYSERAAKTLGEILH